MLIGMVDHPVPSVIWREVSNDAQARFGWQWAAGLLISYLPLNYDFLNLSVRKNSCEA